MIFTIFTGIVFIAELVIAFAIILTLFKFDMNILSIDKLVDETKPKIKSIVELAHKMSEQILELSPIFIEKIKSIRNKIILAKVSSLITTILILSINIKAIKKLRKSKAFKLAWQGLSLMQNMV